MRCYEHAVLIAMRLGPFSPQPGPPFDIPAAGHAGTCGSPEAALCGKSHGSGGNAARRRGRWVSLVRRLFVRRLFVRRLKARLARDPG